MSAIKQDGYIMLLDAVYFNGKKMGNISEDGIDWGGDKPEYIKLNAAQVRTGPVKKIKKKAGSNVLTFKMIELKPQNCKDLIGGEVEGEIYRAPGQSVDLEGPLRILTGTGQTIDVVNTSLSGEFRGKIGGSDPLALDCELEYLAPADGGSPFSISPTVPFLNATPENLSFVAGGESKKITVEASGPFRVKATPAGFTVDVEEGEITVTASANDSGAERGGNIEFVLLADETKKATVVLTQPAN